jgi:hypothetical protein
LRGDPDALVDEPIAHHKVSRRLVVRVTLHLQRTTTSLKLRDLRPQMTTNTMPLSFYFFFPEQLS